MDKDGLIAFMGWLERWIIEANKIKETVVDALAKVEEPKLSILDKVMTPGTYVWYNPLADLPGNQNWKKLTCCFVRVPEQRGYLGLYDPHGLQVGRLVPQGPFATRLRDFMPIYSKYGKDEIYFKEVESDGDTDKK